MRPWEHRNGIAMLPWKKMSTTWRKAHPDETSELDRMRYENGLTRERKKTRARKLALARAKKSRTNSKSRHRHVDDTTLAPERIIAPAPE